MPTVYKWHKRFNDGRTETSDDAREGRPCVISDKLCHEVDELIKNDRRISHRELADRTGLSKGTIITILRDHLNLRKVVARWVPHGLSREMRQRRVDVSQELLDMYRREGRRMIGRIITGDETWVHYYEPESKRDSMQWIKKGDPSPTKFRAERSVGKVLYVVFWDSQGIILMHPVPRGQTINASYYSHFLRNVLEPAVRQHRPGTAPERILFQHDNAPSHSAGETVRTIREIGWTNLSHPAYSPDLAPSDYHLFANLKKYVRGRRFTSRSALGSTVFQWSQTLKTTWLAEGMMRLPELWQKCIDADGAYF